MKAYRIKIKTLTQVISYITFGRYSEVLEAAYGWFDEPTGITIKRIA